MIAEIEDRRDAVIELCRRFGVRRLAVFGSAVTGGFEPDRSDIDFLLELDPPEGRSHFEAFFGLKEGLEALFGRPVDLVDAKSILNPYFARSVEDTQEELYAA